MPINVRIKYAPINSKKSNAPNVTKKKVKFEKMLFGSKDYYYNKIHNYIITLSTKDIAKYISEKNMSTVLKSAAIYHKFVE